MAPKAKMKDEQMLAELERLASVMGIAVKYERMGVLSGGLCRVDDRRFIYINKALPLKSRLEIIAAELKNTEWTEHFIVPEVRALLETS